MNQPLLPKKSSSGQKKKFHFHDKKAGTTVVYTTNKENEKTSLKTSHFGSLATFRNISSVTKKSTHSGSSTTRANISSFFEPVNVQHATSEKEAVKKGKPPVAVTTGFTSTSFSPSLSKNEIPVGKATILRNKENNVDDIFESINEGGDEQNLIKNPLTSGGHVTKRSNSKFPDVEKMKTPSASKRCFTDFDTGSVSDSEFLPQSNGFKRLKKACDDDMDEEPGNVVNGQYQESYFNDDDEFDDIQHELSEAELDLNIPSPPPPEYLSPNNSPARFTDFEDNKVDVFTECFGSSEVQPPPDPIPQISQPRVSASLEVSTEVLQEKLNKTCEDYINVLEEMADTLKTFDDELLQNILGAEKHEVFKKRRIERNRLRAEKKRLSIKLKAKQSVQAPSQRSTSTNPGSLAENEHFDSARAARVGTSSRHSFDSGVLPQCGESFFEKSPPVLERNTSLQPFITTSHSGCTTPTWQPNITKLQNQSKPEMIDLSCDEEPPSGNFLSTPCGSSTPANVFPTRIGPVKIGAHVTPGTSGGLNTPISGACDRSVSSARKSTPAGSNGKAPVKKIGNSLPDDGYKSEFKRTDYDFSRDMLKALRQTFGLKCFRSNQHEAITAALLKKDCFLLMPTGGGKSLCYQLPAIISPGVTIVVSPLKSLIQDQVSKLVSNHIPAFQLTGETTEKTMNSIYRDLSFMEPQTKLLYVTPEKLSASEKLLSTLQGLYNREKLSRFVIDEAHCVSQWGHDFRPDYKKLSALKTKFSGVPMMALTATATPRVRQDVVTQLGMRNPMWFSQSFNRPNLQFLLRPKKLVMKEIIDTIKRSHPNHSGIIYCLSRLECDKLADDLYKAGIEAIAYHAGLADARRAKVQEDWIRDRCKVICATIAFGMGIDKADVRFVFHHSLPKSLEGYFQECGRAGRDGQNAVCILFYSYGDVHRLKRIILSDKSQPKQSTDVHMNNLYRVVQYCENQSECRRAQLLEYFGETGFDKADCSRNRGTICDNCSSAGEMIVLDILKEAKILVESVNTLVHRGNSNWRRPMVQLTLNHLVDVFKGSKNAKVEKEGLDRCAMYGLALKNNFNRNDAERLFRMLLMQDILAEDLTVGAHSQVICYAKLGPKAMDFLNDRVKLPRFLARNPISKRRPDPKGESSTTNNVNNECYLQLVSCCKSLAESRRIKPEHIFADSTLRQMSDKLPMTRDEMLDIEGVTEYKMDNFGQQFLELTITYGGALFASDADMISEVDSMRVENNGSNMERDFESPYWATAANFSGNKTNKKSKSKSKKKKSYQSKKGWSNKQSTSKKKNTSAPQPSNTNSHMNNPLVKSYQDFSKGRKLGPTRQCGFLSLAPRK